MLTHENIAEAAHEVNRAYCLSLGDDSQPDWAHAPEWQKNSALLGVAFWAHPQTPKRVYEAKRKEGEKHFDDLDVKPFPGPEASHESWMAQKKAEEWKFGEKKDPKKKEHPCMVPFEKLPKEQQAKDFIFRAIVLQLLPHVG